jgi:serine/threonine-protein kinase
VDPADGYHIVRRLGSGASGTVYLAETGAGQTALRQFESPSEQDSEAWRCARTRFLEAGRQALGLSNPRIVAVREVIEEGDEAFVASEYVAAETLASAMAARRFAFEEARILVWEIAVALDHAHDHGLVHGDLKPSDIFLSQERPKVADFGISPRAHLHPLQSVPAHLAHRYLSPEHVRSPESLDARSDQYSLAVIAYELFTGQSPYGAAASDLPGAVLHAEILPPSQVEPRLPPGVDGPLLAALSRDPEKRFGSCRRFAAVLEAAFLSVDSIAESKTRGGRRWPAPAYLALAGAVAVAAFGVILLHKSGTPLKTGETRVPPVGKTRWTPSNDEPKPSPYPSGGKTKPPASGKTSQAGGTFSPPYRSGGQTTPPASGKTSQAGGTLSPPPPRPQPRPLEPIPILDSEAALGFTIEVYSRVRPIKDGDSFDFSDPVRGELAHGDLRAIVTYGGIQPPRGRLTLEWAVDGVSMDRKTVPLTQLVEYGNQPTAGDYVLTLYLDRRPVQAFKFTIRP